MDISRMKFCLDNAEHQIKIQETHINRTGRAPCNDLRWIQSVYDRWPAQDHRRSGANHRLRRVRLHAAVATCEGGAWHSGLQRRIDRSVEIIPTELRHQLSKSNLKRQIGDIYKYTSLAYRASKTRKVPPLPPPRCRYATAFHLACAWHRASRRTRRGIARPEIAERKSTTTARVSA